MVAGVADAVAVGVFLIRVRSGRAVIRAVCHAVAVLVKSFVDQTITIVVLAVTGFSIAGKVVGIVVVTVTAAGGKTIIVLVKTFVDLTVAVVVDTIADLRRSYEDDCFANQS